MDIYDIDRSELEVVNRHYALFINVLPNHDLKTLSPLLDQLCNDQNLPLDQSEWNGEFPVYSNNHYEVNILTGEIADLSCGIIVSMPPGAMEEAAYQHTFGDVDVKTRRVRLTRQDNKEIYLIEDKKGIRGRIEKEAGHYRFYKKFLGRKKILQTFCLKEIHAKEIDKFENIKKAFQAFPNIKNCVKALLEEGGAGDGLDTLRSLAGEGLFFDPENPHEGLCFDPEGKIKFKIKFTPLPENKLQWTVVDCRSKKESEPYQAHTLESTSHKDLKKLELFENSKDILLFSKDDKLKKVEFIRYGLSFTLKKGFLMCDHPKYQGYYINLNASTSDKNGIHFSLALKHKDDEMPVKLILADPAVLKNETTVKQKSLSLFEQLWMVGKVLLKKNFHPDEFTEEVPLYGPQHTNKKILKYHALTIRPYTGEFLLGEAKDKILGVIALLKQTMLNKENHLALCPLKHLKLTSADLSKANIENILKFLQPTSEESGEGASVKLQFALKIKELLGKKVRFQQVCKNLDNLIATHCKGYLLQGRKMDQRLCLNRAQFELMASIVKKTDENCFNKHLRIFFANNGELLEFSPTEGTPVWKENGDINLEENVKTAKENGLHGVEQIPLEILEKRLKEPYSKSPICLKLEHEALTPPLMFNDFEIDQYFTTSTLTVPDVELPQIEKDAPSCERKAVEKLAAEMTKYKEIIQGKCKYSLKQDQILKLKKKIRKEHKRYSRLAAERKKNIETLLLNEGNPEKNLAIKGGLQAVATLHELSIAFLQKDLASLQNKKLIPSDLQIEQLETSLEEYFHAEISTTVLQNALKIVNKLADESMADEEKWNQSTLLFQLLTAKRFYDPKQNPELLVYECFAQKIFRNIGNGAKQIDLLKQLVEQPNGIFQAITGAGKTTLLSVLRGLMTANGHNLVTFKMLPTLFEPSKAILEEQLGSAFDKHIYPLRFDLKTPLVIREEKNIAGKKTEVKESSLFKKIYHDLLITMELKGCILTDYKSLPLMQEKWIKLNREFVALRKEGTPISEIEMEHWQYLRKILILLKEREESLMDEFDVPNRSCNRLQIPLGKPVDLPPFLYEKSLELYEELRNDPRLKLSQDQQRDISEKTRQEVIEDLANRIAAKIAGKHDNKAELLDYILGRNENFLETVAQNDKRITELLANGDQETKIPSTYSLEERDEITFYKDQFCTFLPLALKKASELDYKRSSDGKNTVPCHEGEPQENSKFGHPLEEINYTIQDYIQNGITLEEFKEWIRDLQDDAIKNPGSDIPTKQYTEIFPGKTLPKDTLNEIELIKQKGDLNKNWKSLRKFLVDRLGKLTVGGEVISMTPHDMASMPKSVSGLSATLGCPEELPGAFNVKGTPVNGIMGEMVYRLLDRTGTNKQPINYDPAKPFEAFEKGTFHAVIDGAGAFRAYSPSKVAELVLFDQHHLKSVGYYNESHKLDFVGESDSITAQKGFYFSKAKARGADVPLNPTAEALLTVDRQKTLEDLAQNDGRMRLKGQKIHIARSDNNPEIQSTEHLVVMCARNEGTSHSVGLFRSKMQEIPHLVRQEAYQQLLAIESLESALDQFEKWTTFLSMNPFTTTKIPEIILSRTSTFAKLIKNL